MPGGAAVNYTIGDLPFTEGDAWRGTGWKNWKKPRPGMVLASAPFVVAPCSSKIEEWVGEYEDWEVFVYRADEVDWDDAVYPTKVDGFAAFPHVKIIDRKYVMTCWGTLTPDALSRLKQAYQTFVGGTSGTSRP